MSDKLIARLKADLVASEARESDAQRAAWTQHQRVVAEWSVQRKIQEQIDQLTAPVTR